MGSEFGQCIELNYEKPLDWMLLSYESHRQLQSFNSALNEFYQNTPALYEVDYSWDGFSWISGDDNRNSVIAFRRIDKSGAELIAVCNLTPVHRDNYRIGVPEKGTYEVVFTSDKPEFGGTGLGTSKTVRTTKVPMHGFEQSISLSLAGLSGVYLRRRIPKPRKKTPKQSKKTKAVTD